MLSAAHAQKIVRSSLSVRALSAAAAQVSEASVGHSDVQVTKLPNGVRVASCDHGGAVSKVAVAVRAGARYESAEMGGIGHLLKNAMFTTNNNKTNLRMTREMQTIGGSMDASNSRELITRSGVALRNRLAVLVDNIGATMNPRFQHWDIVDVKNSCISDVSSLDCTAKNIELLHEVAFRSGLGNSIFCKEAKLGAFNADSLLSYVQQTHVGSAITVVATNCDHGELVDLVSGLEIQGGDVAAPPAQKYHGGETRAYTCGSVSSMHHAEHHVHGAPNWALTNNIAHTSGGTAYASLVGAGAAFGSASAPAFAVLGAIFGGSSLVPWGSNSGSATSVLNLTYSDAGLFGVHVAGAAGVVTDTLKGVREAAASVTAEDVESAKAKVKASFLIAVSESDGHLENVLNQVAHTGAYVAPSAAVNAVDAVTLEAVQAAAAQALGSASTLVVTGDTTHAPYLDEL